MNIAFSAALVAAIILPGLISRYAYARGSWGWSSPTSMRSVLDEFVLGLILAIAFQALWLALASCITRPDISSAVMLLSGQFGDNPEGEKAAIDALANNPMQVAFYFLTLYAFSGFSGNIGHRIVRRFRLDHRINFFRFSNNWYYLLSGEVLSFDEKDPVEIDGVYLSTVIDHGGTSYLYRGIVRDFTFDKDGYLYTIVLTEAERRKLCDDKKILSTAQDTKDDRYYDIDGDFFVLKFSEAKTINLDYFIITTVAPAMDISPPSG